VSSPETLAGFDPAAIASRYEKLLAVRLINAVNALRTDAPELCASSGFYASWSGVEHLRAETLFRAVRHPLLDAWVQTSERLLSVGAHKRYSQAHSSRHLKDFSRLVLSWVSAESVGASGEVPLLGRVVIPLLFGRSMLVLKERLVDQTLSWRMVDQVLRMDLGGGVGTIAEVSLTNPSENSILSSKCTLQPPPSYLEITLDLWTPEFVGEQIETDRAKHLDPLKKKFADAIKRLTPEQERVVNSFCRCVTIAPAQARWIAGLVNLSEQMAGELTPEHLVEQAYGDGLRRLLRMRPIRLESIPANIGGDFPEIIVGLGARRAAAKLFDRELDPTDEEHWQTIKTYLSSVDQGKQILRDIGEDADTALPFEGTGAQAVLPLTEAIKSAGIEHATLQTLKFNKTRIASDEPVDWRAPDFFIHLTTAELEQVYRNCAANAATSEANAYCAAVSAYLLRRFEHCLHALLLCLRFDRDVEEYWHLLAFSFRHLGNYDEFEKIIFKHERELSNREPVIRAGSSAQASSEVA
jgi:hypothetical protein